MKLESYTSKRLNYSLDKSTQYVVVCCCSIVQLISESLSASLLENSSTKITTKLHLHLPHPRHMNLPKTLYLLNVVRISADTIIIENTNVVKCGFGLDIRLLCGDTHLGP